MRYDVIQGLISGKINATDASRQIEITTRHVQRLKGQVIKYGIGGD